VTTLPLETLAERRAFDELGHQELGASFTPDVEYASRCDITHLSPSKNRRVTLIRIAGRSVR
jgi:hypothetical protein